MASSEIDMKAVACRIEEAAHRFKELVDAEPVDLEALLNWTDGFTGLMDILGRYILSKALLVDGAPRIVIPE